MGLVLTKRGKAEVNNYIAHLKAKRKEILDAKLDTANNTRLPTVEDILDDCEVTGFDDENECCITWGVTDNYDVPICLILGEDVIEV